MQEMPPMLGSSDAHPDFLPLIDDEQLAQMAVVRRLGLRIWQPGMLQTVVATEGVVRLWLVLDGILTCNLDDRHEKALPREVVCADGSATFQAQNVSLSDSVSAIEVELAKNDLTKSTGFTQRYFSDDQKDNKLCQIAAPVKTGSALQINSNTEVYLCELNRWETVLLKKAAHSAVVVLRGSASVNDQVLDALGHAFVGRDTALTITGKKRCEILAMRELV